VMAWPMIEWALDTFHAQWINRQIVVERSMLVFETPESALVPVMEAIEREFIGIRAFSLPSIGDGRDGRPARRHVELGVKGEAVQVAPAFETMVQGIRELGAPFELLASSG